MILRFPILPAIALGLVTVFCTICYRRITLNQRVRPTVLALSWKQFQILFQSNDYIKEYPYIVRNTPLAKKHEVLKVMRNLLPTVIKTVKQSHSNVFTNHDTGKLWTAHYNISSTHTVVPYDHFDLNLALSTACSSSALLQSHSGSMNSISNQTQTFQYLSHALNMHERWPDALNKIVPWARNLQPSNEVWFPPVVWLSNSEGVTASPHYDMQDNFFIQLSGEKTFLMSPPSSFRLLNLYPSLHPRWRQAQNRHMLMRANIPTEWADTFSEVTLHTGDMLYLPSFNFHSVQSGCGSVSINIWLQSNGLRAANRLESRGRIPSLLRHADRTDHTDTRSVTGNTLSVNMRLLGILILEVDRLLLSSTKTKVSPCANDILKTTYNGEMRGQSSTVSQDLERRYAQLLAANVNPLADMPPMNCAAQYQAALKTLFAYTQQEATTIESQKSMLNQANDQNIVLSMCNSTNQDIDRIPERLLRDIYSSANSIYQELTSHDRDGGSASPELDPSAQRILLLDYFETLYQLVVATSYPPITSSAVKANNKIATGTNNCRDDFENPDGGYVEQKSILDVLMSPCALLDFSRSCMPASA